MICKNIYSNLIHSPLRDYDIRKPFRRFNELKVTRPDRFFIAIENLADVSATLLYVTANDP